jgi:metal-sulfur cluster biosynthetic enzyme
MMDAIDPRDPELRPGPPPDPEAVRGALRGVVDPELHASIDDLGMIDDIRVDADGDVTVRIALTTMGCPLRASPACARCGSTTRR